MWTHGSIECKLAHMLLIRHVTSFSVEDHCSPRYSRGSSHRPISPTLSLISGSGGLCNGTNDNVPCPPELAGQTISFRDADDAVANARKILQDWNNRWGSFPFVSSRGAEALRGSEGVKMPLTRAYYELRSMRRIGRVGLLRLRSIACIDTQSIPVDRLPDFWREVYYIMECLLELILRAELLLEICFEVDSST
jgi:hypothetical protein